MEKEKNLTQPEEKKSLFFKFIHGIEVVGNKLPQPFYLFSILIVVAIILSVIFAGATATYLQIINPIWVIVIRHFLSSVFRDFVVKKISKTEGHGSVAKESQNAKKLPERNGSGSRTQY